MSGARIFRPNRLCDFQLGGFLVAQFLCGKIVRVRPKKAGNIEPAAGGQFLPK